MELEQTSSTSAWGQHLESHHNWELWTHIQQLQEQEAEVDLEMKEQLGCNRLGIRKLPEDCLAEVCETISVLKGRISELPWSEIRETIQQPARVRTGGAAVKAGTSEDAGKSGEPGARSRGRWPSCKAGRDWIRPWT
ncbi:hypothetical protein Celaphus_00017472 [Cervus elaphus hippelaphus]|uniref:Uncharacterized protein n=1 Tax=Cervus elaphus hippelaphus TaxID=46360 RepID=A0A212D649_CEREH|nr:hypothetical protein Celaphus_00017472 [Cervus elaphus hippelaphus]